MDPATIGVVLAAIAGGIGGGLGSSLWTGVCNLVRGPFRHHQPSPDGAPPTSSGEIELAALEREPTNQDRSFALAEVLVARATVDAEFRATLQAWWVQAMSELADTKVTNTISGHSRVRGNVHTST